MTDETEERRERNEAAEDRGEERHGSVQISEAGEADEAAEVPERSAELEELRGELDSLNDRHLRLAAEFDNYRKRNERDRQTLATRMQVDLVRSLLEVLDDLERVSAAAPSSDAESLAEGVRLVEKKFRSVLDSAGLEPLEAEGARFDPSVMEALMTVPTGDPEQEGRVADVFQKGYRFRDSLVRPARVRVLEYEEPSE